jgi:TolB-like protein
VVRLVIALVAIGFLVALVLAWAFELSPDGIKRTDAVDLADGSKNRTWIYVGVIAATFSLGLFFIGRYTASRTWWMERGHPPAVAGSPPQASTAIPEKSVAVLPFQNLSTDQENAFFSDGIQDEILTSLARVADLKVISRTSVMQYKSGVARNLREIGQQLGVAHVVEGSVQRSGNRVLRERAVGRCAHGSASLGADI